jgi:ABC-type uncharacterized transport system substrate-binding protein
LCPRAAMARLRAGRVREHPDPVGAGFVDSLACPGGNVTGFTQVEYSTSMKWLALLKQIAPGVTRVGVLRPAAVTPARESEHDCG